MTKTKLMKIREKRICPRCGSDEINYHDNTITNTTIKECEECGYQQKTKYTNEDEDED